jgi:PIN domain nuclease of toxin-antitoxin system
MARKTIESDECFVSMASFWEIAIKSGLGKLHLPAAIERYLPEQIANNGFETLDITLRQTMSTAKLPLLHRDPFDRMLVAQALEKDLPIVSLDAVFESYGVKRIW